MLKSYLETAQTGPLYHFMNNIDDLREILISNSLIGINNISVTRNAEGYSDYGVDRTIRIVLSADKLLVAGNKIEPFNWSGTSWEEPEYGGGREDEWGTLKQAVGKQKRAEREGGEFEERIIPKQKTSDKITAKLYPLNKYTLSIDLIYVSNDVSMSTRNLQILQGLSESMGIPFRIVRRFKPFHQTHEELDIEDLEGNLAQGYQIDKKLTLKPAGELIR